MNDKTLNILIAGEAGQGLVTVGQLLAKSLVRSGYSIVVTQSYLSRIRGGYNSFAIRVGVDHVIAPRETVDLLVALNEDAVVRHRDNLNANGRVILDQGLDMNGDNFLRVPFKDLSKERFLNIAALGVVGSLLGLDQELTAKTVDVVFGKKNAALAEENRQVLATAMNWTSKNTESSYKLPVISDPPQRLMMTGNEAIALGAISAGLRFCAFYPMSPSTSIALTLAAQAQRMGLMVEQAEDEIAAINMALGASFAGAPAMVSTSGGGFALMVEGVSLAAMTETPVVIVVAQRPGPATGLPTRTEQADLEMILHAGHGEFPRAILSPGTVKECFQAARKALYLSKQYQGPVFILTDQFLADSYCGVEPFDLKDSYPAHVTLQATDNTPYHRYHITDDGISPRLLPGMTEHLVIADSDEHTEDGHITEDLTVRKQMVEKRLIKGEGIRRDAIPPDIQVNGKPDLLLLSWGSTKGSVLEAASYMKAEGKNVGFIHFSQVWPLAPDPFMTYLKGAREVVCIEGNATGQFAGLIKRETGFDIKNKVLRYDGLPITPEYILRELKW
jgi:2-oxoglutarate ferredoxin oxidoreductase subunit alpha